MKVKMYCIYDKVSKKCGSIELCENEKLAERMFLISTQGVPKAILSDFELKYLGEFDTENAVVYPVNEEISSDQKELFNDEVMNG